VTNDPDSLRQVSIRVVRVAKGTDEEQGLFDLGKKLMADSLPVAVDYCKAMITISTGAIAVYYALFTYILPKDYKSPTMWERVWIIAPAALLLLAAGMFAFGYAPTSRKVSLAMLKKPAGVDEKDDTSVETAYTKMLSHRSILAKLGTWIFLAGLAAALSAVTWIALSREPSEPAALQAQIVRKSNPLVVCGDLVANAPEGSLLVKPLKDPLTVIALTDVVRLEVTKCK